MRKSQQIFMAVLWMGCVSAHASVLRPLDGVDEVEQYAFYEAALNGDAAAEFQMASFYEQQKKPDYPTILLWLRRSANQGYLEAEFALGKIYHFGKPGITPDLQEAEKWYEKAAAKGDKQALHFLDVLRKSRAYRVESAPSIDDKWDVQWTAKTASYGDRDSQFELGRLYAEGIKIPMDYAAAAKWYEKAAVQGHVEAMCALGAMYLEGKGLKPDVTKALFWYEQAAMRDYNPAQRKLYEVYSEGVDRVPNLIKAAGWLYVSLSFLFPNQTDLTEVSPELEKLFKQMTSEQKDEALYFAYSFMDEKRVRR